MRLPTPAVPRCTATLPFEHAHAQHTSLTPHSYLFRVWRTRWCRQGQVMGKDGGAFFRRLRRCQTCPPAACLPNRLHPHPCARTPTLHVTHSPTTAHYMLPYHFLAHLKRCFPAHRVRPAHCRCVTHACRASTMLRQRRCVTGAAGANTAYLLLWRVRLPLLHILPFTTCWREYFLRFSPSSVPGGHRRT